MKKLLSSLIVLALLLSIVTPAFAAPASDVVGTQYEDAVAKLTALGVINGYTDGTYKPLNDITRAEFAKIIVVATGNESNAKFLAGTSAYKDIKGTEWFGGYVAAAATLGLVKGYEDGTFRPANNITTQEVVTVLMRALGYNDELPGNWPYDYLVKANSLGLFAGLDITATAKANRGLVAQLTSNTLEETVVAFNADTKVFAPVTPAKLFVENVNDGFYSAVVTAPGLDSKGRIELNTLPTAFAEGAYVGDVELGQEVLLLVNADDEIIYLTGAQDSALVVEGTLKVDATTTTLNLGDPDEDGTDNTYTFATPNTVYFNGVKQTGVSNLDAGDSVKLFLDSSKNVRFVVAKAYDRPAEVVKSVTVTSRYNRVDSGLTPYFVDQNAEVTLNGETASISDIKAGYVVYVVFPGGDSSKPATVVNAFNNTVTGAVTMITGTTLTVDGVSYEYNSAATKLTSAALGENYTLTLDKDGKVLVATPVTTATTSNTVKAFFLSADNYQTVVDGRLASVSDVKVLGLDGKIKTYRAVETTSTLVTDTDTGKLYSFTFNKDGKIYTADDAATLDDATTTTVVENNESPAAITVSTEGTIKVEGINSNVVTLTNGNSFLVDGKTVLLQIPSAGVAKDVKETDVKVLSLADLKDGYTFKYALNAANTSFTYVFVTNAPAPTTKAADVYGFYAAGTAATVWDATTKAPVNVYTATVNVDGVDVTYTVGADLTGSSKVFGKLSDSTSNGVYDTFTPVDVTAATADKTLLKVDQTNGTFSVDGTLEPSLSAPSDYIVTAASKVLVVEKDSAGKDVYVLGQFTDLLNAQDGTVVDDTYSVTVVTDGTLGGYNVVKYVVIEKN